MNPINKKNINPKIAFLSLMLVLVMLTLVTKPALAQNIPTSPSVLYIPLIGLTSVPDSFALPTKGGTVTYNYAVKNFLGEVGLSNVQVIDNKCGPVKFVEGDDNNNSLLDYTETWRYKCTTKLTETTQSVATATGTANNITASHKAYATVVVGTDTPPPLVSIVNITKVAYPYSLPSEGGSITFTYKVNNPGVVPLSDVKVTDDKCNGMSGKLGDTNGNNLLDTDEVWIYNCTTFLKQTTTNTVNVIASANGLKAIDYATITVNVANSIAKVPVRFPNVGNKPNLPGQEIPSLPNTGINPYAKIIIWAILATILAALTLFFTLTRKKHIHETATEKNNPANKSQTI